MSEPITIVGNIVGEPEFGRTKSGDAVTTFRVACSQRKFDRETQAWSDGPTNWYSVSTFRRLAEHAIKSLHGRERVVVSGKLRLRQWEDGTRRGVSADIDADAVGHDLLWGTSIFHRDPRASAEVDTSASETVDAGDGRGDAVDPGGQDAMDDTTRWSVPGAGEHDPRSFGNAGEVAVTPF